MALDFFHLDGDATRRYVGWTRAPGEAASDGVVDFAVSLVVSRRE
jgi:hypothetical protein